eukprot:15431918-Heterocapsa_arctica.AAC.1
MGTPSGAWEEFRRRQSTYAAWAIICPDDWIPVEQVGQATAGPAGMDRGPSEGRSGEPSASGLGTAPQATAGPPPVSGAPPQH